MRPALLLLEFDSIAVGIEVGDAMVKRAPLLTLHAGTVHPGKYLVLAGGEVADVEEAWIAGRSTAPGFEVDEVFLPDVDPQVVSSLTGIKKPGPGVALGVIETRTAASTIRAADAAVKGASVDLLEIHLADGLGGKAYALFGGEVSDVEVAVETGVAGLRDPALLVASVVIPKIHEEMRENLAADSRFALRVISSTGA
ncbi:MAG: BMC domain-containing protein [Thermoanaerobaculia bacterium]